jgi:hypothetical protein
LELFTFYQYLYDTPQVQNRTGPKNDEGAQLRRHYGACLLYTLWPRLIALFPFSDVLPVKTGGKVPAWPKKYGLSHYSGHAALLPDRSRSLPLIPAPSMGWGENEHPGPHQPQDTHVYTRMSAEQYPLATSISLKNKHFFVVIVLYTPNAKATEIKRLFQHRNTLPFQRKAQKKGTVKLSPFDPFYDWLPI